MSPMTEPWVLLSPTSSSCTSLSWSALTSSIVSFFCYSSAAVLCLERPRTRMIILTIRYIQYRFRTRDSVTIMNISAATVASQKPTSSAVSSVANLGPATQKVM